MRGQNPLTDFLQAVVRRFKLTDGTVLDLGAVADGQFLKRSGTAVIGETAAGSGGVRLLGFEFDGHGAPLTTAVDHAVIISMPFNCTINEIYIKDVDNVSGTCTIDIYKDLRNNPTPDSGDSITGTGTKPFIAGPATESTPQTDFTNWATTSFSVNDEVHAVLTAVTGHTHLVMFIKVTET